MVMGATSFDLTSATQLGMLRSFYAPLMWAAPHLAIMGVLVLILASLWMRDWTRSSAVALALLSAIGFSGFLVFWWVFLRPIGFSVLGDVEVLSAICRLSLGAMALTFICCLWYVVNRSKAAVWILVVSPVVLLATFLVLAPGDSLVQSMGVKIPSVYPSIWSFLGFIVATAFCLWAMRFVSAQLGRLDLITMSQWILGIAAQSIFYFYLCGAAVTFVMLMRNLSETGRPESVIPIDMRWRNVTIGALIALEALLALAILLTMYLRRRPAETAPAKSPLDVPTVKAKISTRDLVAMIRKQRGRVRGRKAR
jgi:hypothetical protein